MHRNDHASFSPGLWQKFNNFVLLLTATAVGLCLIYLSMGLTLNSVSMTVVMVKYVMIFILPSLVCIPLTNKMFTTRIDEDGIHCLSIPVPFATVSVHVLWKQIYMVEYRDIFLARYYVLKDKAEKVLGWIPFDMMDATSFKNAVIRFTSKDNPFYQTLANEERAYTMKHIPFLLQGNTSLFFSGVALLKMPGDNFSPMSYQKVELFFKQARIATSDSNKNGEFYFNFQGIPGEYELKVSWSCFTAQYRVQLPVSSNAKIRIEARAMDSTTTFAKRHD